MLQKIPKTKNDQLENGYRTKLVGIRSKREENRIQKKEKREGGFDTQALENRLGPSANRFVRNRYY